MAYTPEQKENILNEVFDRISKGESLRSILREYEMPDSTTFYRWIDEDQEKSIQYARAMELRAEKIFEDILDIADDKSEDIITTEDGREIFNQEFAQRSRIRIDARKWMLGKMQPKKYGDRVQQEHSGEIKTTIVSLGSGVKPDEATS